MFLSPVFCIWKYFYEWSDSEQKLQLQHKHIKGVFSCSFDSGAMKNISLLYQLIIFWKSTEEEGPLAGTFIYLFNQATRQISAESPLLCAAFY